MTISWSPLHDFKSIIKSYEVSYTSRGGSEHLRDVAGNTTIAELTGLKPQTEYTIRVRAKAAVDFGDYSTPFTAITHEYGE